MANFETHLAVASISSGLLSSLCLGGGIASPVEALLCWMFGTLGGILPDIDSDHSTPLKIIFTSLALIATWLVMFNRSESYSILELWMICGVAYLFVRYALMRMFSSFTIHRGVFHSVLAAFFFWFFVTNIVFYLFRLPSLFAWVLGFFVFFGFLVHLSLDELYSVDLSNNRIKRSFGTALKIIDSKNMLSTGVMLVVTLYFFQIAPSSERFTQLLLQAQTYKEIRNNFLPKGSWFLKDTQELREEFSK
jgi:hypothetical protein